MPDERSSMNAFDALRQVANSLREALDMSDSWEMDRVLDDSAMMIEYIVLALEQEIRLAQERGRSQKIFGGDNVRVVPRQLPPEPSPFAGLPLCSHRYQFDCPHGCSWVLPPVPHLIHYRNCNCLADKAVCCQENCDCGNEEIEL